MASSEGLSLSAPSRLVGCLLILGGDSLADFALALVPGIVVGTVSTIPVAVPLTVLLEKRWPAPPPDPPADRDRPASGARCSDGAVV